MHCIWKGIPNYSKLSPPCSNLTKRLLFKTTLTRVNPSNTISFKIPFNVITTFLKVGKTVFRRLFQKSSLALPFDTYAHLGIILWMQNRAYQIQNMSTAFNKRNRNTCSFPWQHTSVFRNDTIKAELRTLLRDTL